jgi:hypothetical protein
VIIGKDYPKPIVDHATESKENMNKMKMAYDVYKERQKQNGNKRSAGTGPAKSPAKKKQKSQR